jgi:hypothetical protein
MSNPWHHEHTTVISLSHKAKSLQVSDNKPNIPIYAYLLSA